MKLRFFGLLLVAVFLMLILQSVSGGRAAVGGQDRTGSPGSLGTCTSCHANTGAFSNPQLSITVKTLAGVAVTEYTPGETYTVEFTVTSNGSPSGYGMQAVALDTSNSNIGDFISTSSANTQLSTITNGREFVEHMGRSSTGIFTSTWMAPATGSGEVTIHGIGIAVDGSSTAGDNTTSTTQFVLPEATVSGLNDLETVSSNYNVFPIPNNGTFSIQNKGEEGDLAIRVLDMQGKVVYNDLLFMEKNGQQFLQVDNLIQGLYFVEITNENKIETISMLVNP